MLVLHLSGSDFFSKDVPKNEAGNRVVLWLIVLLLILTGVLAYVLLNDFGKKSLVKIRINQVGQTLRLSITNVSGKTQRFDCFELQVKRENNTISNKVYYLKKTLQIATKKKWSTKLEGIGLEELDGTNAQWLRLMFSGEDGINYFSNKLRLS